jgi:methylmalonyl-CoA mutase N-terminal domain/subunit
VTELTERLAANVSAEFSGVSEVGGVVDLVEEMVRRG